MYKNKPAFSLLELLTVIAIISLMVGGSLIYFSIARQKARDTKRLADIRSLSGALELYYRDEGRYPATLNFGEALIGSSTNITYLETIPANPQPYGDGNCPNNEYEYGTNITGGSYMIDFCLGGAINEYGPGTVISEPAGLSNFYCGTSTVFYDGGHWNNTGVIRSNSSYYKTLQIGDQCWLADNLNTKMKPDGNLLTNLADDSERDCVSLAYVRGTEVECALGYTVYTGLAALNGDLSGGRGICPPGWHVPTDNELWILEDGLKDASVTCAADRVSGTWDCDGAGTSLKVGGDSGFDAKLVGYRSAGYNFNGQNTYANYWSSDTNGAGLWNRVVQTGAGADDVKVNRAVNSPDYYSFPIRCIKDTQSN